VAPPGELRVNAGVVCWQVKLCDPHLSALEVRFSRRGAIQIDHIYLLPLQTRCPAILICLNLSPTTAANASNNLFHDNRVKARQQARPVHTRYNCLSGYYME